VALADRPASTRASQVGQANGGESAEGPFVEPSILHMPPTRFRRQIRLICAPVAIPSEPTRTRTYRRDPGDCTPLVARQTATTPRGELVACAPIAIGAWSAFSSDLQLVEDSRCAPPGRVTDAGHHRPAGQERRSGGRGKSKGRLEATPLHRRSAPGPHPHLT
jgi:hypothetical protein